MAFETKDNTGSMFANDRKDNANQPDGKGSCMIDGVEYWVSSWNKKTQDGKPWRSLAFTRKEQAQKPSHDGFKARQLTKSAPQDVDDDSSIPF